jgi:hypothetical protein
VLFLLLAFSVFVWGTSYKLSLYKDNSPGSLTPAKLCKLKSDQAKSEVDHVIDGRRALTVVFLLALFPPSKDLASRVSRRMSIRDLRLSFSPLRVAPVLHLRPPPQSTLRMFL